MINVEDFVNTVRQLASDNPDFAYHPDNEDGECQYVHGYSSEDGVLTPGCIMGQAFHALGVSLFDLSDYEGKQVSSLLRDYSNLDSLSEVSVWADRLQKYQDDHMPWGEAVTTADLVQKYHDDQGSWED